MPSFRLSSASRMRVRLAAAISDSSSATLESMPLSPPRRIEIRSETSMSLDAVAVRARRLEPQEAQSPSLADAVSRFQKAVSDGKFRAAVPDPKPDEGAVNPWLADQISKLAVSRDYRA